MNDSEKNKLHEEREKLRRRVREKTITQEEWDRYIELSNIFFESSMKKDSFRKKVYSGDV
jgi:hypothetical protein